MEIAISGASGFVGSHLIEMFTIKGYTVIPLGRELFQDGVQSKLCEVLNRCDVVINLAGAPINHRWSKEYKQEMYESRIGVTKKLVSAINSLKKKPLIMISTSAVGYYPSMGCFDEYNSQAGDGFLSKLCVDWERESQKLSQEVRLVNTRFGVILAAQGGSFSRMIKPASMGVATIIGNGKQPLSWIDLDDHGRAIEFIIDHPEISGAVNLVAPSLLDNREFTKAIAKHFKSIITLRIPAMVFKLFMGESAQFITEGQCVKPTKLLNAGFVFRSNTIGEFLKTIKK